MNKIKHAAAKKVFAGVMDYAVDQVNKNPETAYEKIIDTAEKYLKDFELFRDVSIYAIQRVFLDVFLVDIPTDSIRLVLAQGGYMNMKEIQGYDKILNQKLC